MDAQPTTPSAQPSSNPLNAATAFARTNPNILLALVAVLLAAVFYLVAKDKKWFGLGAAARAVPKKKETMTPARDDPGDPEAERLIDEINAAS